MHNAIRTTMFLSAGLAAGFAIATWNGSHRQLSASVSNEDALAERVAALEQSLRQEATRRAVLAGEVEALRRQLADGPIGAEATAAVSPGVAAERGGREYIEAGAEAPADETRRVRVFERYRDGRGDVDVEQRRVDRLVDAGFPPDRAAWISRRTSELRMQALEDEYRAAREGEAFDPGSAASPEATLRTELGDPDYERYLRAIGRPTSIAVRSVLASSPAEQSGLLPGDEVVAYGGQRVFDVADLNRLTFEGRPGETVALDVIRDGQQLQLYVPRGPIGIMGGGRFGRRP